MGKERLACEFHGRVTWITNILRYLCPPPILFRISKKHINIKNVRLIQRDAEGYTFISAPSNSETVKCFMQNDLGLDDLFLQDMLGE